MKTPARSLLAVLATAVACAQPLRSPDVQTDGRVTFRLPAPEAGNVAMRFESDAPVPM